MNTLIVYAHPEHESHSKTTLEFVEEKLKQKGVEYEVLDLYHMKFNPVMSYEELYHSKDKGVPHEVVEIQKKITHSKELIFIYPSWWNGMPAILKGFIDRIFTGGYAFKYVNGIPRGLLQGRTAKVFVSTGASKFLTSVFQGNRFKKNIGHDILGFCGIKARVYQIDKAHRLDDAQKHKIHKIVDKAFR
ncbi:MAG: NAD(P)H-dependent oxidoreductase [Candidatus Woesearchaeota archaeon]